MSALDKAKELAKASGATVYIGVRSNGTWFAHCDDGGIEWDGATPMHAIDSVIRGVKRQRERDAAVAAAALARSANVQDL